MTTTAVGNVELFAMLDTVTGDYGPYDIVGVLGIQGDRGYASWLPFIDNEFWAHRVSVATETIAKGEGTWAAAIAYWNESAQYFTGIQPIPGVDTAGVELVAAVEAAIDGIMSVPDAGRG